MLGIPDRMRACLFDLDGVLTRTADVHAAAWKAMFDDYLRQRAERTGTPFAPFDLAADYDTYVDGKPRADGAGSFLASRGIRLTLGSDGDPPGTETIHGLGNAKNQMVLRTIAEEGVYLIPGSLRYLNAVRDAGLVCAVVSSSANCRPVLAAAGIAGMVDVVVDGLVAAGRAGGFGWVVGVDRGGQAAAPRAEGADVAVTDLADLLDRP